MTSSTLRSCISTLLWQMSTVYTEVIDGDCRTYRSPSEFHSSAFIQETTRFDTFDEFRRHSPWNMRTWAEIQEIPDRDLDSYVTETTRFDSWNEMTSDAAVRKILNRYTV